MEDTRVTHVILFVSMYNICMHVNALPHVELRREKQRIFQ